VQHEIRDVCAVLFAASPGEATTLRESLLACGITNIRLVRTAQHFFVACKDVQPDVAILCLGSDPRSVLALLSDLRAGTNGANRYLPVIVAQHNPSVPAVAASINAGMHEFLVLPATIKSLSTLIYRAIFVSRPFIIVPGYAGPCRRRRHAAIAHAERRCTAWSGYVHASHRVQAADAAV
jgi:two-component system, chemotaxis family, chemotaxis protein CheY